MVVVEQLAQRVAKHSGAALLIDYGQNKPYTNSLTAIRNHEGVNPLSQPGTADVSAWVDFAAMRVAAEEASGATATAPTSSTITNDSGSRSSTRSDEASSFAEAAAGGEAAALGPDEGSTDSMAGGEGSGVDVYGPLPQGHLLLSLGIQTRAEQLAQVRQ
jgi:NADH dehydrogenase [ubiquinone] 1 alpha subcomplex assembly factor 7